MGTARQEKELESFVFGAPLDDEPSSLLGHELEQNIELEVLGMETKERPLFVIDKQGGADESDNDEGAPYYGLFAPNVLSCAAQPRQQLKPRRN